MRYSYVPESEAAHSERIRPWMTRPRDVTPPPLIPARPPAGPAEFADKRQAGTLGKLAIDLGWRVEPWYWKAHDGTETCALRLGAGPRRAVATWERHAGAEAWASSVAYAWNTDMQRVPTKVNITQLTKLIKQIGAVA
jgi:hypothetical protein